MSEKPNKTPTLGTPTPGAPLFTKYHLAELILLLVATLFGVLYLKWHLIPIGVILPIFLAIFIAVPILRYLDGKKSGRDRLSIGLNVGIAMLPGIVVIIAIAAYFLQGV